MPLKGGKRKTRRNYKRKTFRRKQKKRKTRRKSRKSKKRRTRRRRKRNMRGGANTLKLNEDTVSNIIARFNEKVAINIGKDKSNSIAREEIKNLKILKIPYPVFQLDKGSKGEKTIHFYKLTTENEDTTAPTFKLIRDNVTIPVTCGTWNCKVDIPENGQKGNEHHNKVLDLDLANEIAKEHDGVYDSFRDMLNIPGKYAVFLFDWSSLPSPNQETPEEKKERQERQRLIAEEREKEVQDRDKKIEQVKEEQKAFSAQIAKDQAENNPYNKYKDMTDDDIKNEYTQKKAKLEEGSVSTEAKKKRAIAILNLAQTFKDKIAEPEAFNKSEDLKEFFTKEYNEYVVKAKEYATKEKKWLER